MPLLHELLRKYIDGSLTETEKRTLYDLLRKGTADEALEEMIDNQFREWGKAQVHPFRWRRWLVAACLVSVLGGAAFLTWRTRNASGTVSSRYGNEVYPGGNRASLTLANGHVIDLDSAASGLLQRQGSAVVSKQRNGQLRYATVKPSGGALSPAGINILATPKGGQYEVVLSDGTRVLLNAASSLQYPTAFQGQERVVLLTGEAYFQVAKDAARPFFVETENMRVQVLGTSFDIMAYDNEPTVRTTLLEGKVREVGEGGDSLTLAPGQQAVLQRSGNRLTKEPVDTDEVVAWKEGLFLYSSRVDIPTIMRQLERWYDIDVHYEGKIPEQTFYGGIQRNFPLSKVLSILERTGVRFRIEGKEITVLDSPEK